MEMDCNELTTIIFICTVFVSHQPQTPNLEEDLNEVILREAGIELVVIRSPAEPRRKSLVSPLHWLIRGTIRSK